MKRKARHAGCAVFGSPDTDIIEIEAALEDGGACVVLEEFVRAVGEHVVEIVGERCEALVPAITLHKEIEFGLVHEVGVDLSVVEPGGSDEPVRGCSVACHVSGIGHMASDLYGW